MQLMASIDAPCNCTIIMLAGRAQPSRAELAGQLCQVCRAQPSTALHGTKQLQGSPVPRSLVIIS